MKKILVFSFLFLILYIGYKNKYNIYSFIINVSGNVDISTEISKNIKPNSILYITLRNDKNIIFAVKEIINPVFPLNFKISRKNVLYPDISSFKLKIETVINTHGNVGKIKTGDIYTEPINANIFSRNLRIKIDKIKD